MSDKAKSFAECSLEELNERLKKHKFCIQLIKAEIKKKGGEVKQTTKQTPKKVRGDIQATKDEMKKV